MYCYFVTHALRKTSETPSISIDPARRLKRFLRSSISLQYTETILVSMARKTIEEASRKANEKLDSSLQKLMLVQS